MKLAQWLSRNDMTREEFARKARISLPTVSLLCRNLTWPTRRVAQQIYAVTDGKVGPNDFLQKEAA